MRQPARPVRRARKRVLTAILAATALLLLGVPAASADIEQTAGDGLVPALRWAGDNRYDTAGLIATDGPADAPVFSGDTVVLARGDVFADGLTGSYLAGVTGAPVLLTNSTSVPPETTAALAELTPDTVILLGGPTAISSSVETALSADYEVVRYGGDDRYATAAAIAAAGAAVGGIGELDGDTTAILATGRVGVDALVAGPLAADVGLPLLLTAADSLTAETSAALTDLGIERVIVIGGETAVTPAVATAVENLGVTVERLAGGTRDQTALAVATFLRDDLGWTITELAFAGRDERSIVDAIPLGPRAALSQSPILLAGAAGPAADVRAALPGFDAVEVVTVAGGPNAVSPLALAAVRTGHALRAGQLAFPRGMTIGPDGALYVAESGFGGDECVGEGELQICVGPTGAITRIAGGEQTRAYEGLPSGGPGAGPSDVAFDGTSPYASIGGGPAAQRDAIAADIPIAASLSSLAEVTDTGVDVLADLAAYEAENNSDGLTEADTLDPPLNSNPFGVVRDNDRGVWLVTDAGANALMEITDAGDITAKAVFPQAGTPEAPAQSVPTSVVIGPDGDYYVSELAAEVPGESRVWQVDADTGDATVFADGFTFALDLGFDAAGNLYVLQAVPTTPSDDPEDPGPGTIIRVDAGGERTELGGGALVFPLGLQVTDSSLWVSHCPFCPTGGEVLELAIPQ